jgi:hypothetical protein
MLKGLADYACFIVEQSVTVDCVLFDNDREHLAFYQSLKRSLAALARGSQGVRA